jgi:hypothetical protein
MGNIEITGVQDIFYIWDPRLGGLYGLGAFQTFTNLGGRYYPTPGGGSYADTASFDLIQSGQAFFVRGAAGGTINLRETAKASGFRQVFRGQGPVRLTRITLYEMTGGNPALADGATVEFDANYSNRLDYDDAMKLQASGLNVGLMCEGQLLAVEKRRPVNDNDTLHVNLSGAGIRSYRWTINMTNMDTAGRVAFLYDRYLNNSTLLDLNGMTYVEFSCDTALSSRAPDRFMIIFRQMVALPLHISDVSAIRESAGDVKISWTAENEEGVDHYEVERGMDGRNFSQNFRSQSPQNSGRTESYSHIDDEAPSSCLFYRIKMVGLGGQLIYSTIVKVMPLASSSSPDISLYPNPVKDHKVNLIFGQHPAGNYHLSLLGASGQIVWQTEFNILSWDGQIALKLPPAILPGVYQLLVKDPLRNNLRARMIIE